MHSLAAFHIWSDATSMEGYEHSRDPSSLPGLWGHWLPDNGLGLDFGGFMLIHQELPVAWGCLDTANSCPTRFSINSPTKERPLCQCTFHLNIGISRIFCIHKVWLRVFYSVDHNTRTLEGSYAHHYTITAHNTEALISRVDFEFERWTNVLGFRFFRSALEW